MCVKKKRKRVVEERRDIYTHSHSHLKTSKNIHTTFTQNPLSNSHPPINPQNLPSNPLASPTHHPRHRLRNLLRLPQPIKRIPTRNRVHQLFTLPLEKQLRRRRPRRNAVDMNPHASEVLGHDARHLFDGTFGRRVEEVVGRYGGEVAEGGAEEDYMGVGGHVGGSFLLGVLVMCAFKLTVAFIPSWEFVGDACGSLPDTKNTAP
jgi:hypothetical protein